MRLLAAVANRVGSALAALDNWLVAFAAVFGTTIRDPRRQTARLLGVFATVYLLALLPVPVVPFVALAVGYVGIVAVGRAWVRNEQVRADIARKFADGNPDELPDLRRAALLSALQLLLLFPLLFMRVHDATGMYRTPGDPGFLTWLWFTVDATYLKALPDWTGLYGIHVTSVEPDTPAARHLILFTRLTFDLILLQGVIRLVAIHRTVRETMRAVTTDVDLLVRLGTRAVPPLIAALDDPSDEVRANAAVALGKLQDPLALAAGVQFQDPRVVPALVAALGNTNRTGAKIAEVLGGQPDDCDTAVDALLAATRHPDWQTREAAVSALGVFPNLHPRVIEPLIEVLRRPPDPARPPTDDVFGDERRRAAYVLGQQADKRAVEPLVGCLTNPDKNMRRDAAQALAKLAEARPELSLWPTPSDAELAALAWALRDVAVDPLVRALADEDEWVRDAAAEALGKIGDPRAADAVAGRLTDPSGIVRPAAIEALGRLGDRRAVEPAIRALEGDIREMMAAVSALGRLPDTRAVEPLIVALSEDNQYVRDGAMYALCQLNDPRAAGAFKAALRDPFLNVRMNAAEGLGRLGDPANADDLYAVMTDPELGISLSAAIGLGLLRDPRGWDNLLFALTTDDARLRGQAARALGVLGDPRAVAPIEAMLAAEQNPETRKWAEQALPRLKSAPG